MGEAVRPAAIGGRRLALGAGAVLALGLAALCPLASAASDPLSAGATTITLSRGLFGALKKARVRLVALGPAKVRGDSITLPVIGGSLDPSSGRGSVRQAGGLQLSVDRASVSIRGLALNTATGSVTAKLGDRNLKLCAAGRASFTREGFGTDVTLGQLRLTPTAAKALNEALGLGARGRRSAGGASFSTPVFRAGQQFGASSSTTQPRTLTVLAGGDATLRTDPATDEKFNKVGVSFEPIGPARENPTQTPTFLLPIAGGSIATDADAGIVESSGGAKLVQKELEDLQTHERFQLSINLESIWVDLEARQALVEVSINSTNQAAAPTPGNVGRTSIAEINLSEATISSNPISHTVSLSNANATLQPLTAETLNSVFVTPLAKEIGTERLFEAGDSLGTFSFTAQTQ
jgi:hypothetical protein